MEPVLALARRRPRFEWVWLELRSSLNSSQLDFAWPMRLLYLHRLK